MGVLQPRAKHDVVQGPTMLRIFFVNVLLAAASATILLRDDFSTDGNLAGTTPDVGAVGGVWSQQSATTTGRIVVSQGAITVSSALTEDLNSAFTAAQTTGTVYAGMDLNYPTPSPTTGTTVTYFTMFANGIATTTSFVCRVFPTGQTNTSYKLGLSTSGSTPDPTTTAEYPYGTTIRLVYSYNVGATSKTCQLWVNPTSETPSLLTTSGSTQSSINRISFRQATAAPPWTLSIRNLIVATTFAEVCPPPPPPPSRPR